MKIKIPQIAKELLWKYVAGMVAIVLLVTLTIVWRVSRSHARHKASELLSASADFVRCAGGDAVAMDLRAVQHAFRRRLVAALPDISPVSDCPQALETVQDKLAAHASVWFGSASSNGKDGQPLSKRFKTTLDELAALAYMTPANKVLQKRDENAPLLRLPGLALELFGAAEELCAKEGADQDETAKARNTRLRFTRKVPPQAPNATTIAMIPGRVAPENWGLQPADQERLMLFGYSDKGNVVVASTENAGVKWEVANGSTSLASKPEFFLVGIYAPGKEKWLVMSHLDEQKKVHVGTLKVPSGAKSLSEPQAVLDPPLNWSRPIHGGEREVVVLNDGILAYPVMKIVEKSAKQKKEEEKLRKYWQKHLDDKTVQADMALEDTRFRARQALGIDEEHLIIDGVSYVIPGKTEASVRELEGYGLIALVGSPEPMMVLGKDALPAMVLYSAPVPGPDDPIGAMATATSERAILSAFRGPLGYRCNSSDGWMYGISDRGLQLVGVRPGVIELTFLKADVPEQSHIGCGESTMVAVLPITPDRIFGPVFTVRGGEVEGSKAATTSGTYLEEYNRTTAAGLVAAAIAVAWVSEGYVQVVVSRNWGTDFGAPELVAESTLDGSLISGVRVLGVGTRIFMALARETCSSPGACNTTFEALVSDDNAHSWHAL